MERLDKRGQPSGDIRSKITQLNGHRQNKTSICERYANDRRLLY